MAINEEYNSKIRSQLYDDAKAKHQFKDKIFSDNKCYYDSISGRTLHYDNNAAKQKYHMKIQEEKMFPQNGQSMLAK